MDKDLEKRLNEVKLKEDAYEEKRKNIENSFDKKLKLYIRLQMLFLAICGISFGAMVYSIHSYVNLKNKGNMNYKYFNVVWIVTLIIGVLLFISYILLTILRIKLVKIKEDKLYNLSKEHNLEIEKFNKRIKE